MISEIKYVRKQFENERTSDYITYYRIEVIFYFSNYDSLFSILTLLLQRWISDQVDHY